MQMEIVGCENVIHWIPKSLLTSELNWMHQFDQITIWLLVREFLETFTQIFSPISCQIAFNHTPQF